MAEDTEPEKKEIPTPEQAEEYLTEILEEISDYLRLGEVKRKESRMEWALGVELLVLTVATPLILTQLKMNRIYQWFIWVGMLALGLSFLIGFSWLAMSKRQQYETAQDMKKEAYDPNSLLNNLVQSKLGQLISAEKIINAYLKVAKIHEGYPGDIRSMEKRIPLPYNLTIYLCFGGSVVIIGSLLTYFMQILV